MDRSGTAAMRVLGKRLQQIRHEQGLTLKQLGARLNYSAVGRLSEIENGKRVAPADLLRGYAARFDVDERELLRLRAAAVLSRSAGAAGEPVVHLLSGVGAGGLEMTGAAPAPAGEPAAPEAEGLPGVRQRSRSRRLPVAVAAVVLLGLVGLGMAAYVAMRPGRAAVRASFTSPGALVDWQTPAAGTVTGLRNDEQLWLATQATDDPHIHPTEQPCTVAGGRWSFPTLYLGAQNDAGKKLTILVLASRRGTAGDQALVDYANRPKGTPDQYVGMPAVPADVHTVGRLDVTRR